MKDYIFVGGEADVGKLAFRRLGQKVTFSDDEFEHAIRGGVDLVPAEQFTITPEECKQFPYPGLRRRAPQEFLDRLKAHVVISQEIRAQFEQEKESA